MPYDLTEEQRQMYRETSRRSQQRKIELLQLAAETMGNNAMHEPRLNPEVLMPQVQPHGLVALSLFSGGGGLDLGFERSGYSHAGSYELLEIGAQTLATNRPDWRVFGGEARLFACGGRLRDGRIGCGRQGRERGEREQRETACASNE